MNPTEGLSQKQKTFLGIGAFAIVVITGVVLFLLIRNPGVTAALADISIIIVAITLVVLDVLLVVLVWQIYRLLVYLMTEIVPIMENLQETVGTVRGTATFMSDSVVTPSIQVVSKAAGWRRSIGVLFGGPGSGRSRPTQPPAANGQGTGGTDDV